MSASSSIASASEISLRRMPCSRASMSISMLMMCGVRMNILWTVSVRVDLPPNIQPIKGMSLKYGMPQPAFSSMSLK